MAASKRSPALAARLTRKLGPLPVWAWAAVILGSYLLYERLHAGGQTAPQTPAETAGGASAGSGGGTPGDSGLSLPSSGQGSPADNVSQALLEQLGSSTSAIDALTSQILSQPALYSKYGDAPAVGSSPSVSSSTPAPSTPLPASAASPPGTTQTQSGVLYWDGKSFTAKAAFDAWAKAHGTTSGQIFMNHPAARQIYGTLQ